MAGAILLQPFQLFRHSSYQQDLWSECVCRWSCALLYYQFLWALACWCLHKGLHLNLILSYNKCHDPEFYAAGLPVMAFCTIVITRNPRIYHLYRSNQLYSLPPFSVFWSIHSNVGICWCAYLTYCNYATGPLPWVPSLYENPSTSPSARVKIIF